MPSRMKVNSVETMSVPGLFRRVRRCVGGVALCGLLGGCAVIQVSTDKGCASYLALGIGVGLHGALADAAVVHGRVKAVGLYGQQGPAIRVGIGVMEERWIGVDPDRADVVVNARSDSQGGYEVVIQSFHAKENGDEAGVLKEVRCRFDGPVGDAQWLR